MILLQSCIAAQTKTAPSDTVRGAVYMFGYPAGMSLTSGNVISAIRGNITADTVMTAAGTQPGRRMFLYNGQLYYCRCSGE